MIFKSNQAPTVVFIRRPLLWVISFIAINCAVLLLLWLAFDYGQSLAGFSSTESRAYINELEQKLENSQDEFIATSRQATMLERNSQIVDGASGQLREALVESQNEVLELKKELSFYKSIVSPEQGERSLAIQSIQLTANDAGGYEYKLMVSQRGKNDRFVRGKIEVSIIGVSITEDNQDEPLVISLAAVSNDTKEPMSFGFKYFQNFTGVMTLPNNFLPDSIRVEVKPSTSKVKAIKEQFVWSDLTSRGI